MPSVDPVHLASMLIQRCAIAHCAAVALVCAGCVGNWRNGQSLETLTDAPFRYPTAVARQTPHPAPEIANKPLVAAPSDDATQPKPQPVPPPQWPIHSNKPTAPVAPRENENTAAPQVVAASPPDDLASQFAEKSLTTMLASGSPVVGTAAANFPPAHQPAVPAAAPIASTTDIALAAHQAVLTSASNGAVTPIAANPTEAPAEPPKALHSAEPTPATPVINLPTAATTSPPAKASVSVGPTTSADQEQEPKVADEPEAEAPSLEDERAELIAALEAEVRRLREAKAEPAEIARVELQLRLLYLVAERPENAVAAIEGLSPPERESLKHLMFGLSTFMSEDDPRRATHRNAKVLRSLRDATHELAAGSRLDLKNLTFCEKVDYFGWYTEFSRAEFQPKQQVILYVEVENFSAEEKGPHSYETELQGSYQIFDGSGAIVAERKLPLDREVCRNYRRDYFLAYRLYMPDNIPVGAYRLELTIEDHKARGQYQGRKLGHASLEFSIR